MRGLPEYKLPTLKACMEANLAVGQLTNPNVKFVGVAVNTSQLADDVVDDYLSTVEAEIGLPTLDPFRDGVARIVDVLD